MKLIDEKGRVFGKINIIDLIVVVLVIAMVALFAMSKVSKNTQQNIEETENVANLVMEFSTDEVYDYVLEHVKKGEMLHDADYNKEIGIIKDVIIGPSRSFATTTEGEIVLSPKEGFSSLKLVCDVEDATIKEDGIMIDNVKYGVGHTFTVRTGFAKIYLKVSDIQIKK